MPPPPSTPPPHSQPVVASQLDEMAEGIREIKELLRPREEAPRPKSITIRSWVWDSTHAMSPVLPLAPCAGVRGCHSCSLRGRRATPQLLMLLVPV